MIIWLASYPRSGNFLLRTLIHQTLDLKSYPYPREKKIFKSASAAEIIGNIPYEQEWDEFYKHHNASDVLTLIKTYDPPMDQNPAIYVVRDGRKVFYSYYRYHLAHTKEIPLSLLNLVLGADWFGDWSSHYHGWMDNCPHSRLLLRYEDLVEGKPALIHKISAFIGGPETSKVWRNPMDKLHQLMPDIFRQGYTAWENPPEWTPEVDRAFWAIHGKLMRRLGYARTEESPSQSSGEAEEWRYLSIQLKQRMQNCRQSHATEDDLLKKRKFLVSKKWVNQNLKKIRKQKPSPFKSPIRWSLKKWVEGEVWQAGKLHQYDPIPAPEPSALKKREHKSNCLSLAIVVPSYNQGEFIEATVRSILDQKYPDLKLALLDGGSRDETLSILDPLQKNFAYFRSHPDEGQAAAINEGFSKITGDICAWLNSDDLFLPGTLGLVTDYFSRNPDVDAVYGHRLIVDRFGSEVGRWILPRHNNEDLKWFDLVPQETLFFRRGLWEKVGGLDPVFQFALDWDLLLRFIETGAKIVRLPFLLGAFRIHNLQKTSQQIETIGREEMKRIRTRIHGEPFPEKMLGQKHMNYKVRAALYARLFRRRIRL